MQTRVLRMRPFRPSQIMAARPQLAILAILALSAAVLTAGCGAGTVTAAQAAREPQSVHIQRTIGEWITNGGQTPAPTAVNVTRTDSARVTQFYQHIRGLPSHNVPSNTVFHCPVSFGRAVTLITFTSGRSRLLQVQVVQDGCVFTSIVGSPPSTYLTTDQTFTSELNDLIAHAS